MSEDPRKIDHDKTEKILALIDQTVPADDPEVRAIMERQRKAREKKR